MYQFYWQINILKFVSSCFIWRMYGFKVEWWIANFSFEK